MKKWSGIVTCIVLLLATAQAFSGCGSSGGDGGGVDDGGLGVTEVPSGTRYRVSYRLACLQTIDYMQANPLFNYLLAYEKDGTIDPRAQGAIATVVPSDSLTFLVGSGDRLQAEYDFEPRPRRENEDDGLLECRFDAAGLPEMLGMPYVTCEGELEVGSTSLKDGDGSSLDAAQREACLEATPFWPADDPAVKALAREITAGSDGEAEKLEALFDWVRGNIDYSGGIGTRYGTSQVLSQGYGRCWDASDVFVTLSRAAGLPARQLSGWLARPDGCGHIWSQAWLVGEGWVDVDTTNNRIGAGDDYVPFRCTEDGEMPVLYVGMPVVEEL
jgi:hypothetical protein